MDLEHFFLTLSNLTYISRISTIYNSLNPFVPKSNNAKIENNTHCVYAIGFRRSTMLEYIYNGHSIAYDPISQTWWFNDQRHNGKSTH